MLHDEHKSGSRNFDDESGVYLGGFLGFQKPTLKFGLVARNLNIQKMGIEETTVHVIGNLLSKVLGENNSVNLAIQGRPQTTRC